jgi:hypothetical protein
MAKTLIGIVVLLAIISSICCIISGFISFYLLSTMRCSVGVAGTAAVIEISGFGAIVACHSYIEESKDLYTTNEQPSKPIVCIVNRGNLTYTIRDEGLFKIQGTIICNSLIESSRWK